jgi:hypothetical protein
MVSIWRRLFERKRIGTKIGLGNDFSLRQRTWENYGWLVD